MPSAVATQPNLASEMGDLQERITSTKIGSITSVQPFTARRRLHRSRAATTFAHLDARRTFATISELGIYPAVDPLAPLRAFSIR